MFEPMKGYNFRFTENEIKILDSVRADMDKQKTSICSWRPLTRTDVIKVLIRREWASIQDRDAIEFAAVVDTKAAKRHRKPAKGKVASK